MHVLADAGAVALEAAALVAARARVAVQVRGCFTLAVSGGRTPWRALEALAREDVPWDRSFVFQVDERVAPAGHPERNWTHLRSALLDRVPLPPERVHAMPVEAADLEAAAADYARRVASVAGAPVRLDLVLLGLGADGHTASLVPGDPVLEVGDRDVATTGPYRGLRRMTLTFPALDRARSILWIVTGADKAAVLPRLLAGDRSIPAGRVRAGDAVVLADREAAGPDG